MKITLKKIFVTTIPLSLVWLFNTRALLMPLTPCSLFFWFTVLFTLTVYGAVFAYNDEADEYSDAFVNSGCIAIVITVIFLAIALVCSPVFSAKKYTKAFPPIETKTAKDIVPSVKNINNLALVDTNTASVMGTKKLGGLGDKGSQLDIGSYTTICYKGKVAKVAPLEYGGLFEFNSLKNNGTPGYIVNDPVTGEAKLVKTEKGMKYMPSAFWSHDLMRHIYDYDPTLITGQAFFEISDDGTPYYVVATYTKTSVVFSNKVNGVVTVNAITGKIHKYSTTNVPSWIETVYNGDFISNAYTNYGTLKRGFFNSIFSKKGCTMITTTKDIKSGDDTINVPDYGYLSDGKDIWLYTGIKSARSGNSSTIGLLMVNGRTGKAYLANTDGADEQSAMDAANGEMQQYKYQASFPSLINLNNHLVYVMVMTDKNNIVKNYACVDSADVSKVYAGDTVDDVINQYNAGKKQDIVVPAKTQDIKENATVERTEINSKTITLYFNDGTSQTYDLAK